MHIPNPFHKEQERGDTIVEVLIALAIISSVLAGAFFVTNRSAQNVLNTEEHARATQLLQGQIEQIRASKVSGMSWTDLPNFYCYDTDGSIVNSVSPSNFGCDVPIDGSGSGPAYTFLIEKETSWQLNESTLFRVSIAWEGVRGQDNSEQMLYKIQLPKN